MILRAPLAGQIPWIVSLFVVLVAADPLFAPVVTYDSGGSQASMVTTADVNGDGKPDVVAVNCGACYVVRPPASIAVMLGNGDGSLQPAVTYDPGGVTPLFVAVADVNHDAADDLVVANRCGTSGCANEALVGVLLNRGDGTFEPAMTFGTGGQFASSVAVADLNDDGNADIVVANNCADADCNGSVGVLLGDGDGTFQSAVTYRTGTNNAVAFTLADVNSDRALDIIVAGGDPSGSGMGRLGVLLANGDGTFLTPESFGAGGLLPSAVVAADLNRDGRIDLAVEHRQCCTAATGAVVVFIGNGDGTFLPGVTYQSGARGPGTSVAVADVDGDGALDLLTTEQCAAFNCLNRGVVDVFRGNGDGTFKVPLTYGSGGFLTNSIGVGDLNGDGAPDLVVANQCSDDSDSCRQSTVGVLLNAAAPVDTTPPVISLSASPDRLWPPNGKWVPVIVSGVIADATPGVDASTATYSVVDEYSQVQPGGSIRLDAAGHFSFTILLRASRRGTDASGRTYIVRVAASDTAGNRGTASTVVIVPHDVAHPSIVTPLKVTPS
jgi:hypothetical protein